MTQTKSINSTVAITGTVIFHAGLVLLGVMWIAAQSVMNKLAEELAAQEEMAEEVVIDFIETPVTAEPEPAVPQKSLGLRFVDTNGVANTDKPLPSDQAAFLSDKNTRAASEGPASMKADSNLPSQQGEETNVLNLRNKQFADGDVAPGERKQQGLGTAATETPVMVMPKPPEPLPVPAEPPPPQAAQTPPPPPDLQPDEPNALTKIPEPKPAEPPAPPKPDPKLPTPPPALAGTAGQKNGNSEQKLQSFTQKNKLIGGVSTKGEAGVDSADTPQGRYMARVSEAVSKTFHPACAKMRGKISYGSVTLNFDINTRGETSNLNLSNLLTGEVANQEVALDSIARAKFPPIPADLSPYLIDGKLNISFLFTFR